MSRKCVTIWGPHAIMIAWGEEERSLRLSPAACGGARLSGFSDDERAQQNSREIFLNFAKFKKISRTFPLANESKKKTGKARLFFDSLAISPAAAP